MTSAFRLITQSRRANSSQRVPSDEQKNNADRFHEGKENSHLAQDSSEPTAFQL